MVNSCSHKKLILTIVAVKTKNLTKYFIYILWFIKKRIFKKRPATCNKLTVPLAAVCRISQRQTQKSGHCGQVISPTSSECEEVILNTCRPLSRKSVVYIDRRPGTEAFEGESIWNSDNWAKSFSPIPVTVWPFPSLHVKVISCNTGLFISPWNILKIRNK